MLKQILIGSSVCVGLWVAALPVQAQSSGQPASGQPAPSTEAPAQAQPATPQASPAASDVSQSEIEKFANAVEQIQSIQSDAQQQANQILQQEQLTPERFSQILQTERNPQAQPSSEVSPEDRQKFERVSSQLNQLQQTTRQQMDAALQEEGIPRERFTEILAMVRQDASLRQRIEQELKK